MELWNFRWGRHLYSARQPSRWWSAHILVILIDLLVYTAQLYLFLMCVNCLYLMFMFTLGHNLWNLAFFCYNFNKLTYSVCLSVTSRCSTETAKRRITQTTSRDDPMILVFWCRRSLQNSNGVIAGGGFKIGDFRQITRYNSKMSTSTVAHVVNLVRSQVYHTSHWASTFARSTFAVMQCVARVR